ncbi:unnamed protein product [Meloidogyne enterolobii]|uniref:Uncharacterized protein n=1 Tax=Meloidogyne enterolobii TaxID=390850 RepID=A0ACB0ZPC6_MELEN
MCIFFFFFFVWAQSPFIFKNYFFAILKVFLKVFLFFIFVLPNAIVFNNKCFLKIVFFCIFDKIIFVSMKLKKEKLL